MNILIIDDNTVKANDSKKCLQTFFPNAYFNIVLTGLDGIQALMPTYSDIKYNLVILDMQFSFHQGEPIDNLCGVKVLRNFYTSKNDLDPQKQIDTTIPVIVCSSMKYPHELDDFDNVKGYIRYSGQDLTTQYEQIIPKIRKFIGC